MTNPNLSKDSKILLILESPNKKSTVSGILKKAGYSKASVMASVGHIMQLSNNSKTWKNTGIHTDDNFKLDLDVMDEKKKTVNELKLAAKSADFVYLATDPDREGWVIAWSLAKFLNLDKTKTFRFVTHEITPKAVIHALENPIPFDNNIVDSGLARWTIDKMLGYSLSNWAQTYVGAKSVGRCQSAGLKILTDREREIEEFKPEDYYDLYLDFKKKKTEFRAKYVGTKSKKIDHFKDPKEVERVASECINDYKILDIVRKEKKENPKPPFDTPSFQQEASSKLKLKVKDAQACAQKLFEGIEVNHQHVGLVTYIRTDSTDMSPEFIPDLKNYIETTYGKGTFKTPRVGKKQENAQDGHEALRCTDPSLTPEKLETYIKNDLLIKVYKLIWQRTIASAMPPATISETTYVIENNGHLFNLVSNEVVDQGYRAIYSYKDEDEKEDGPVKETFDKDEKLLNTHLTGEKKSTKPPKRFSEATFIKEMQRIGLGRPSTYATIVETILSKTRGYCELDGKEMVPTTLGKELSKSLDRCYPDLINLKYTSEMEKDLDLIAEGKMTRLQFIGDFHKHLVESLNNNSEGDHLNIQKTCPECGAALVVRRPRFDKTKIFLGCSNYPNCKHAEKIK